MDGRDQKTRGERQRKIILVRILGILFLALTGPFLRAENVLKAVRVGAGPRLDGRLDDEAWKRAVPFTNFLQAEPNPNSPPSERTEVRICYDARDLYIGVFCADTEPSMISANTMAHDADEDGENDDNVKILLDPFQDKRTAYVFFVNPRGARTEGLAFGEHPSLDWDGIWDARAEILENGWSAEIRIPFKTICFNPRLLAWGINIERYIPRRQETIRASGTSLDSQFFNPNEAAALEGIEDIKQGSGITIRPYGLLGASRDPAESAGTDWNTDVGIDIYKNITPNFVGAFSYNTDFAETEVDERRVNLTRFPLFFPEKRTFFLEGSEYFNFGPMSDSFVPFFSRRIGLLEDGEQVPILFGAKMYGRLGRTNISVLDVATRPIDDPSGPNLPGRNLTAVRVYQNLWEQSRVGFIFTSGNPEAPRGVSRGNTLAGMDFRFSTSRFRGDKNLAFDAWAVYNWNTPATPPPAGEKGRKYAFGARIDYPNDLWDINLNYAYYGDALNPGLGFISRKGVQTLSLRSEYMPRPKKETGIGKLVRQFFLEPEAEFYWDLSGRLETRSWGLSPAIQLESGDRIEGNVGINRDVLPYDFEVSDGVVLPRGPYDYTNYRIGIESATHRPVQVELNRHFGQFYSGRYSENEIGISLRYKGYATLGIQATFVRGRLPQGDFDENVYQIKADLYFSPDLGLMNYVQYDDVSRELGIQSRFRWKITPGNEIFLVYSRNWERRWDPMSRFVPMGEHGVFKIQLTIRP